MRFFVSPSPSSIGNEMAAAEVSIVEPLAVGGLISGQAPSEDALDPGFAFLDDASFCTEAPLPQP